MLAHYIIHHLLARLACLDGKHGGLTEHHLQPHQTAHEVVEVDGHVGVGVSSHQQLVDGVVEGETWRTGQTLASC